LIGLPLGRVVVGAGTVVVGAVVGTVAVGVRVEVVGGVVPRSVRDEGVLVAAGAGLLDVPVVAKVGRVDRSTGSSVAAGAPEAPEEARVAWVVVAGWTRTQSTAAAAPAAPIDASEAPARGQTATWVSRSSCRRAALDAGSTTGGRAWRPRGRGPAPTVWGTA
jgi:hypothetical protein